MPIYRGMYRHFHLVWFELYVLLADKNVFRMVAMAVGGMEFRHYPESSISVN